MTTVPALNARTWRHRRLVRSYRSLELRDLEADLFERYRDDLRGRVLELGCGAGRVTSHLVALAEVVDAVDLSPAMLARCRSVVPEARLHHGDIGDLTPFADAGTDAVVAACNVIDVLDDPGRDALFAALRRVLVPGGLLIFSSHNHEYLPRLRPPWHVPVHSVLALGNATLRLPVRLRNHRRLRRYEQSGPGYAIRNDSAHDYALLHYYVTAARQQAQLAAHGFTLLECRTLDGRPVTEDEPAPDAVELHYVARASSSRCGRARR